MQGPLREGLTRISARFSAKDLCRIMQGPLREESAGFSQEPVYARSHNENATDPELENPAAQTLREPAQSKCTWASHKSNFTREFTGKQPQDRWRALIYITPALTPTVRTPQCGHTVWGKTGSLWIQHSFNIFNVQPVLQWEEAATSQFTSGTSCWPSPLSCWGLFKLSLPTRRYRRLLAFVGPNQR